MCVHFGTMFESWLMIIRPLDLDFCGSVGKSKTGAELKSIPALLHQCDRTKSSNVMWKCLHVENV